MSSARALLEQGIASLAEVARLDVQVLLAHVLGVDRAMLYAHPEREISSTQEQQFLQLIERRKRGEPVAYLVGHKEFYGRDFLVDQRVLIPRPETELLVETALSVLREWLASGRTPIVAEIGTGSGAIPITLAIEEPRLSYLYASDISPDALEVARLNCQRHQVAHRVRLLQGDLLAPLPEPVDLLVANLPYVGTDEMAILAPDVRDFEPHLALFSGSRGLELLRRLFLEVYQSGKVKEEAVILLEIGYRQRAELTSLVHERFPQAKMTFYADYSGWDRMLRVDI